jgi:hypothetical protein
MPNTRQLAEVLLKGVSGLVYPCPERVTKTTSSNKKLTQVTQASAADSPWKPYTYNGLSLFIPQNENEEIILLLKISEAMAAQDAVLSHSSKFKET